MHERRKAPKVKAKSKWQQQYEKMMENQKKMQELKQPQKNKK